MNKPADGADYCTRVIGDLATIGDASWNALIAKSGRGNPFLRYEFLHALHVTGCAAPRSGWEVQYLTVWHGEQLAGAVPLYRKHHSYGEYVFDWAWASAYQQHGIEYYPKWLAAVPFHSGSGRSPDRARFTYAGRTGRITFIARAQIGFVFAACAVCAARRDRSNG